MGHDVTNHTHQTAPTQFVEMDGIRFAYRRFGIPRGLPIVLNQHFRGSLDYWDSAVTNGLARTREVILFNNAGIASSSGDVPTSIHEMAANAVSFTQALDIPKVDMLGFSIGGLVAQEIVLQKPSLLRKLILVSTGLRGADMSLSKAAAVFGASYDSPEDLWLAIHFTTSATSRVAGHAFLRRMTERMDRDPEVSEHAALRQREAINRYLASAEDTPTYLERIALPVLIIQGGDDIMMPASNAFALQRNMPNAQLILYPDANHAPIYRHPELFVRHASIFLDS